MATMVKSVSGSNTTYVITGNNAATVTAVFAQAPNATSPLAMTSITNSGNVQTDAQALLTTLLQLTSTGLLPESTPPTS